MKVPEFYRQRMKSFLAPSLMFSTPLSNREPTCSVESEFLKSEYCALTFYSPPCSLIPVILRPDMPISFGVYPFSRLRNTYMS